MPSPLKGITANHKRADVIKRIARIHGHVHAAKAMLEEGRSYSEVAHQISAIRAALDAVIQVIVDDLVEDCVETAPMPSHPLFLGAGAFTAPRRPA
jgi:DNA-binding FrmR family transcriptional regulator